MLKNKKIYLAASTLLLFFAFCLPLMAQKGPILKLRFYQGQRTIVYEPLTIVTSSYLSPFISANIPSSVDVEEERKQIRRVFNLIDVRLLTEAELAWTTFMKPRETISHVIRFDSREIFVAIAPSTMKMTEQVSILSISPYHFNISIAEQYGQEKIDLLNTEIIIPLKNVAVLGFESRDGIPYFLALHVLEPVPAGKKGPTVGGVVRGVVGTVGGGQIRTESGAVRAIGDIKPPRLIKKVEPIYPEEAKKAGVEGIVILEAETDEQGNIVRTKVLRSIPLLDQAAIDAVRQWKYEPAIIEGKPTGIVFTVTVSFQLRR